MCVCMRVCAFGSFNQTTLWFIVCKMSMDERMAKVNMVRKCFEAHLFESLLFHRTVCLLACLLALLCVVIVVVTLNVLVKIRTVELD